MGGRLGVVARAAVDARDLVRVRQLRTRQSLVAVDARERSVRRAGETGRVDPDGDLPAVAVAREAGVLVAGQAVGVLLRRDAESTAEGSERRDHDRAELFHGPGLALGSVP